MRSQGWAPGEYLGAKDASHSEYYGAASASHIRAVIKDDNMGLGARRNQGDECTGLDALQDLLSRLNGKSEEAMGEERRKREDTKINKYLHRKLGTVRFVYGGLLVGDKVQELADSLKEKDQGAARVPGPDGAGPPSAEGEGAKKEKKSSKKRKSEDREGTASEPKKSKKRKTGDADEDSKSKRKDKKDKKDKKKSKDKDVAREDSEASQKDDESDEAAATLKKAKKEKKEKKEKRRKAKEGDDDEKSADAPDSQSRKKKKRKSDSEAGGEASQASTKASTPSGSGISTPISGAVPHRHLARSRFIAQKRAAVMDQAALNQIFMVKA